MIICPYCGSSIPENLKSCPICGGGLDIAYSASEPLSEGSVIKGKYRIEQVLGSGGFGITYLAYDEALDRKVAVKEYFPDGVATRTGKKVTIPPTLDNNENLLSFKNEAKSIAKLRNAGIVNVYDVIEENSTVYIIMEYIEGEPFSSMLGKIGEKSAVKYMRYIAEAIGSVHSAGMLHQDIKPENIILAKDGSVKIIDFGSSRVFAADKTKTYEKILTPGYAPLEQYGGRGKRGEYTDIYAICATLYALLKGSPPLEATELAGGAEIDFSGISEKLKDILKKGLSIKIPERIQNTGNLIKLFDELENEDGGKNIGQAAQTEKTFKIDQTQATETTIQTRQIVQAPTLQVTQNVQNTVIYDNSSQNFQATPHGQTEKRITGIIEGKEEHAQIYSKTRSNRGRKNLMPIFIMFLSIIVIISIFGAGYFYYPSLIKIFKPKATKTGSKEKKESKKKKIKKANKEKLKKIKSIKTAVKPPEIRKTYILMPHYRSMPQPPPQSKHISKRLPSQNVVRAPGILKSSSNIFHGIGYRDFNISGCFYCHNIYGKGNVKGSNLSHIGSQLSLPQIENQIISPNSSMPPNPNMPDQEAEQIAGWLESLK